MAITVYVKPVDNYPGRSIWDNTSDYSIGDRVEFDDGNLNRVYVCLLDHATSQGDTPQQPNISLDYWAPAGGKEYPFLSGNNGNLYSSGYNSTELCVGQANSFTSWDPARQLSVSDGSARAHVILLDGVFKSMGSGQSWTKFGDTDFEAENNLKTWLIEYYYEFSDNSSNCPSFKGLKIAYANARKEPDRPVIYKNCIITQETPLGNFYSTSLRFCDNCFIRAEDTFFNFRNSAVTLFCYNSSYSTTFGRSLIKNCTIIIGSANTQYNSLVYLSSIHLNQSIFYFNELGLSSPYTIGGGSGTEVSGCCFFAKSFTGSVQEISTGSVLESSVNLFNVNPSFIDPDNGNFSLRPSSPLIGGIDSGENKLSKFYPDGVWVDHNSSSFFNEHDYVITGDGSNYTFSGDAAGIDPVLNVSIKETLTFSNTGGHPLAIYNSQNELVASESNGTTTFVPRYEDTYYYQCTVTGHENMRGDIVVTLGALGSYEHPFESYHDAIDSGYYKSKLILLFKEGDHLMSWYPGTNYANSTGISSSFPGGLSFVGEDPKTTRFTTGNNLNGYSAFYVGTSLFSGSSQSQTPLTIEGMGFHINNNTSYLNRGLFSGIHWKSFTLKRSKVTCDLTGSINSGLFDYFHSIAPAGYEFNLSGCEVNIPISDNNGPGGNFLSGSANIKYAVESCTFLKLSGYNYVHNGPSPVMIGGTFSSSNGSEIKDCIFYSNTGGNFSSSSSMASGVFSSCIIHSTTDSFTNLPEMDINSAVDPLFIDTLAGSEDLRLRPSSVAIGGLAKEPTNVYYLQPDNPFNGDGSQKDASAMTADGDPGPFNEFKEIIAAGVPYGSTIIIVNGTYDWTESFGRSPSTNVSSNTWYAYTCAGYNYIAETSNEVIFDANLNSSNVFIYKPYGGTFPTSGDGAVGTFLDLDTTFTGIQFNNMIGVDNATRNQIGSVSGSAGLGSCTFKNCKFLGHVNTTGGSTYPWTGGGRTTYSSTMHWENCEISIAFDNAGSLLGGGDGFANDQYHGAWSWRNCTFYIPTGLTTFNGRNAANGTYVSPGVIFGYNYSQVQREFKNNIIHIPNGTASIGVNGSSKLPKIENNCFNGVSPGIISDPDKHEYQILQGGNLIDVDPSFVDANNNNFNLRPSSILIGKGK
jgi:plastocyanin